MPAYPLSREGGIVWLSRVARGRVARAAVKAVASSPAVSGRAAAVRAVKVVAAKVASVARVARVARVAVKVGVRAASPAGPAVARVARGVGPPAAEGTASSPSSSLMLRAGAAMPRPPSFFPTAWGAHGIFAILAIRLLSG
jgi:hypothetical protein